MMGAAGWRWQDLEDLYLYLYMNCTSSPQPSLHSSRAGSRVTGMASLIAFNPWGIQPEVFI
jgi:hypothetical protein